MAEPQKILVVDDRRENLVAMRSVFADMEVELVEVLSGNDALAATLTNDFAVAILDVMMPGMDGYELAEYLRGDEKTKALPIVFVTACNADEHHVFRGYEAGAVDYIVKPLVPQVLRGKVRVFLEIDRYKRELRTHKEMLEQMVGERTASLEKRVKESTCLFSISRLIAEPLASLDETLRAIVDIMPSGWRYPQCARARIVVEASEFAQPGFTRTPWMQFADIEVGGKMLGSVELCYLESKPMRDDGPFDFEEGQLIADIARQLGVMVTRDRASRQLRESEKRFRVFFEHAPIAQVIAAPNGTLRQVNAAFREMLGSGAEKLVGRTLAEICAAEDRAATMKRLADLLHEEQVSAEFDTRLLRADRHPVPVTLRVRLMPTERGEPGSFLAHVTEIRSSVG